MCSTDMQRCPLTNSDGYWTSKHGSNWKKNRNHDSGKPDLSHLRKTSCWARVGPTESRRDREAFDPQRVGSTDRHTNQERRWTSNLRRFQSDNKSTARRGWVPPATNWRDLRKSEWWSTVQRNWYTTGAPSDGGRGRFEDLPYIADCTSISDYRMEWHQHQRYGREQCTKSYKVFRMFSVILTTSLTLAELKKNILKPLKRYWSTRGIWTKGQQKEMQISREHCRGTTPVTNEIASCGRLA